MFDFDDLIKQKKCIEMQVKNVSYYYKQDVISALLRIVPDFVDVAIIEFHQKYQVYQ